MSCEKYIKDSSYTFQASASDNQQNFGMLSTQIIPDLFVVSCPLQIYVSTLSQYLYTSRLGISSREHCQITKKQTNQRALPIDTTTWNQRTTALYVEISPRAAIHLKGN